jgi:hypothetical protein
MMIDDAWPVSSPCLPQGCFHAVSTAGAEGKPKRLHKNRRQRECFDQAFCPECGSPLYTSSPRHPEFYYLKAGCLDDPTAVRATHQNWLKSRVPWAAIGSDLPSFSEGPNAQ